MRGIVLFSVFALIFFACKKEDNGNEEPKYVIDVVLGSAEMSSFSFTNIPVNSIVVDATGAKWIGTNSGLYLYKNNSVFQLNYFNDKQINSMIRNDKNILIATSEGSYSLKCSADSVMLISTLSGEDVGNFSNHINVYGLDPYDNEWLGALKGLAFNNKIKWKWNQEIKNNMGGVIDVRSMAFRENDFFFGTYGDYLWHIYYQPGSGVDGITGASKLLGESFNPVNNYNGELTTDTIFCVFATEDGYIWFGSETGLTRNIGSTKSGNEDAFFDYYLRGERVYSILETSENKMWAGTENGIFLKSGDEWINFNTTDGLPDNKVNSIAEDTDFSIWIGTDKGISHYANNEWKNF